MFNKVKLRTLEDATWSRLGAVLGPSWAHLGAIYGLFVGRLGPSGEPLGPQGSLRQSWGHLFGRHLGAILGPSGAALEPSWAVLGTSPGHLGVLLGPS